MGLKDVFKEILIENANNHSTKSGYPLIERNIEISWIPKKATILKGVRRSGKSTLAEMLVQKACQGQPILQLNFADERLSDLNIHDLQDSLLAFEELHPELEKAKDLWLIFDEIQMIEGWELFVERLLRNPRHRITITGSSAKLLSQEIATEMRGRGLSFEVFPLSFAEFLRAHPGSTKKQLLLDKYMNSGGFPELMHVPHNFHKKVLQEYFESICFRDVIERHQLNNAAAVKDLALLLASQHAQLITINKLFERLKSMGHQLQKDFVTKVVHALQDSYAFFSVPLWSESRSKQNTNPKKNYCVDSGMVTAIRAGVSENRGRLLEGVVFCQLLRQQQKVNYFKTEKGLEIDFVAQDDNEVLSLIQVCAELTSENIDRELAPFLETHNDRRFKKAHRLLITGSRIDPRLQIPSFIDAQPAWEWIKQ